MSLPPSSAAMSDSEGEAQPNRRSFLRSAGLGSLALATSRFGIMAGPFTAFDPGDAGQGKGPLIPVDKKLDPAWVKSLTARGTPTIYSGGDLKLIGMPVGGIGAGQLYLGGDGKLWLWDLANSQGIDNHYTNPMQPRSPFEQGFALEVTAGGATSRHALDHTGFTDIAFRGEYPIGMVTYKDPAVPVSVTLEAFSPFIPLNVDDSSLPATVMSYTLTNTSAASCQVLVTGWLENAICQSDRQAAGTRSNHIVAGKGVTVLACTAVGDAPGTVPDRPDIPFEDWNKEIYSGWTVEGTAFGTGPVKRSAIPPYMGDIGGDTDRMANSHASAPGDSVAAKDAATGKLTSRPFTVTRRFINLWIGGGQNPGVTCVNVVADGAVVGTITGRNSNHMELQSISVQALAGKQVTLQIIDASTGGWGNIGVGRILFSDHPAITMRLDQRQDFGEMSLALLGAPAEHTLAASAPDGITAAPSSQSTVPLSQTLIGALGRKLTLDPGKSATVVFLVTWRFPNLELSNLGQVGRFYAARFPTAQAVAEHIAGRYAELSAATRLWRDTWYDSTLPYWLLDRTLLNVSILATSTAYRLHDGRFYGWEGVSCCEGTCTHVWQYEQAVGRLFPALDVALREYCEFKAGVGFDANSGVIFHRGECLRAPAVDGQAGTIMRAYRDHQMQCDHAFLKRNWAAIKKATQWLIQQDGNGDGILEGAQHNTLDAEWFGPVPWLSGLYLAALRASEEMAKDMQDTAFAAQCRAILDASEPGFVKRMFNGEYFIQIAHPDHRDAVGSYDGCEIDQVFGQQWAYQVGLGDVLPPKECASALQALWKYNFTLDVGPFREANKEGRWFAVAGDGGLLMCTFPHGEASRVKKGYDFYFNECMTGFEHQVASHMVWVGMITEGLAVERSIHDRYHAARRNPWNEVECGDHYARAMASYGVYVASCGYEYHGPKRHLGFAPRWNATDFKAAFTAAEGWGSFQQRQDATQIHATIRMAHGQLALSTLAVTPSPGAAGVAGKIVATLAGKALQVTVAKDRNRLLLTFPPDTVVGTGATLVCTISVS